MYEGFCTRSVENMIDRNKKSFSNLILEKKRSHNFFHVICDLDLMVFITFAFSKNNFFLIYIKWSLWVLKMMPNRMDV